MLLLPRRCSFFIIFSLKDSTGREFLNRSGGEDSVYTAALRFFSTLSFLLLPLHPSGPAQGFSLVEEGFPATCAPAVEVSCRSGDRTAGSSPGPEPLPPVDWQRRCLPTAAGRCVLLMNRLARQMWRSETSISPGTG